jgi:hypothetical protein
MTMEEQLGHTRLVYAVRVSPPTMRSNAERTGQPYAVQFRYVPIDTLKRCWEQDTLWLARWMA